MKSSVLCDVRLDATSHLLKDSQTFSDPKFDLKDRFPKIIKLLVFNFSRLCAESNRCAGQVSLQLFCVSAFDFSLTNLNQESKLQLIVFRHLNHNQ